MVHNRITKICRKQSIFHLSIKNNYTFKNQEHSLIKCKLIYRKKNAYRNLIIVRNFDFVGRQFDKNGNMKEWWNNVTISCFKKQIQCIIDQYSSYKIEEIGMNLNGLITQGENIADNGGLKQAFRVSLY